MVNYRRNDGDLYRVKADTVAQLVASRTVVYGVTCAFMLLKCRDLVGGRSPFAPGLLRQTTLEFVRHPVGLATPYRAAARGQPPTQPPADIAKLCPRAVVW